MMKERLEEIACVVVGLPAAICDWLNVKIEQMTKKVIRNFER